VAQHHLLVTLGQAEPGKHVGALGSALRVERDLGELRVRRGFRNSGSADVSMATCSSGRRSATASVRNCASVVFSFFPARAKKRISYPLPHDFAARNMELFSYNIPSFSS
jgi:hypothetical protein